MNRLLTLMLLAMAIATYGQEKRINLYSAYVFDDKFETYNSSTDYFNGTIRGGYEWGAGLEFKIQGNGIELLYMRQDTKADISYYNVGAFNDTKDISVSYYLLGLNRYLQEGKVEPYGGFMVGAAGFINKEPNPGGPSSATKFALGLRLGVNVWAAERVAIKLQAHFLSAIQGAGGGFYFGTGGGGAGVSTYSTLAQFGLGGGLSVKIGD